MSSRVNFKRVGVGGYFSSALRIVAFQFVSRGEGAETGSRNFVVVVSVTLKSAIGDCAGSANRATGEVFGAEKRGGC
jgi:hypothetical protein